MSLMDLSEVVDSFSEADPFTVTRGVEVPVYEDGVLVSPLTETLTVTACIVPINGRELERLQEGDRNREFKRLYTTAALYTLAAGRPPDRIAIAGEDYEVQTVQNYADLGAFYVVTCLKVGHGVE